MCSGFLLLLVFINILPLLALYLRAKRVREAMERLSFDDVAFLKLFYPKVAKMLGELIALREKGAISNEEYERNLSLLKGGVVRKELVRFGILLVADICSALILFKTFCGG